MIELTATGYRPPRIRSTPVLLYEFGGWPPNSYNRTGEEDQRPLMTSTISSPASVGFSPTFTPAASRASIFAFAVPVLPDTMAPAWPIFLPAGAVTPAM